jgi:hypothetical protein
MYVLVCRSHDVRINQYLVSNIGDVLVVKVVKALDEACRSTVQRDKTGLVAGDVAVSIL